MRQFLIRSLLFFSICGAAATHTDAQQAPARKPDESVIGDLRTEAVAARRNAAIAIRNSERKVQQRALPNLIELLRVEKDGQVRLAVLDCVTALGSDAVEAIPSLVHSLRTDFGGQQKEKLHQDYRCALALAAIGKPAVQALRDLLSEEKDNVRADAAMALGRIGPDSEAAVADLVALLGDKQERIRREAALALGRIGDAAADALIEACASDDAIIRQSAVEGLGHLFAPDERIQAAAAQCALDAVPEVRAAAVRSLANLELADDALSSILHANLQHEDEVVRMAVVNVLAARPELLAQMATELEILLTAEHAGVSRDAAFLMQAIGLSTAPRLLDALHHQNSRIDQIAEALSHIGRPVYGLLVEAMDAADSRVRQGAALALGQIRPLPLDSVERLVDGLDDPDRDVQAACLTAIGYLGPRAREAVAAVRSKLQDESPDIRMQAIDILFHAAPRDERLLDDLIGMLGDNDPAVQRCAIDTIRSLGPLGREALPAMTEKLQSTNPDVRLAAAEMIGSHGQTAADALPALVVLLNDPAPELRTIVAQTIGDLEDAAQEAFEPLTLLLDDEQATVRIAGTSALGRLGMEADVLRPHLVKALGDKEKDVRDAALRAIGRLGRRGATFIPDVILLAEKEENRRSIEWSLRRFRRTGPDERSVPALIEQLSHEQHAVRLLAVEFLGLAGKSAHTAIPALERLCEDDPSEELRKLAKTALEQIQHGGDVPGDSNG
jgi:HEAT repeat protein